MDTVGTPVMWGGFLLFVAGMLALDLGVFHRKAHAVGFREALGWTFAWMGLAGVFAGLIAWRLGSTLATEFVTGYFIEKSLSIDNVFVFVVVFAAFKIPPVYQHRVLFWGVLSALVLRGTLILAGAALLEHFHALLYVFGAFLVFTGVKLFLERNAREDPTESRFTALLRRVIPSTPELHGSRFFVREGGRRLATPLLLALAVLELTDLVFALDGIPAVFAVTLDPFIVFTSNIFAMMGLRSLFFVLAGAVERFRFLKIGLSAVLVFVGAKMLLAKVVEISPLVSLAVVVGLLGVSIVASLWRRPRASQLLSPLGVPVPPRPTR